MESEDPKLNWRNTILNVMLLLTVIFSILYVINYPYVPKEPDYERGAISRYTCIPQYNLFIDNVDCSNNIIYIRNTGWDKIPTDKLSVYTDNTLEDPSKITWDKVIVPINDAVSATTITDLRGKEVKVSIVEREDLEPCRKIVSDTYKCP